MVLAGIRVGDGAFGRMTMIRTGGRRIVAAFGRKPPLKNEREECGALPRRRYARRGAGTETKATCHRVADIQNVAQVALEAGNSPG